MTTVFGAAAAAMLWLVTAWRAPAAWRDRSKRALWTAFCALAVVMTLRPGPAARLVDDVTGVTDLSFLGKHLGGVVAASAVLTFVHNMSQEQTGTRSKGRRLRTLLPAVTATAMVVLFASTPQPHEATDLLTDYASDPRIVAYGAVFTAYLGSALLSATRLCWRWGRDPGAGLLGWGLRCVGIGTSVGIGYAVHRVAALVTRYFGIDPVPVATDEAVSDLLLMGTLLLITVGSSVPALSRVRHDLRSHRDLLQLYPLWRSLTDAVPSVRLDPPRSIAAERRDLRRTGLRLYRRTVEIRDAALALNDHASASLREQARLHVEAAGLLGAEAVVAAEACWLETARRARLRGEQPTGEPHLPASGGRDIPSETRALKQLATAYGSDLTRTFADSLDHARAPETQA